jgi:hypothetical protein
VGRTKSDRAEGADKGKGTKRKVIEPKTPHMDFKGPKTRAKGKVSQKEFLAAIDIGNRQPTINMRGGVGIPGKRTKLAVQKFTTLDFSKLKGELSPILEMSKSVREMRDRGEGIEPIRKKVKTVNRQVVFQKGAEDVHSLHVGNDIAAVSNGRNSKVYDYPDLAPKLDKRLARPKIRGKTYWKSDLPLGERRAHVAEGFQHLVGGNNEEAQKAFGKAGLTPKGQKWINKMGTLMLAERGRELHGGGGDQVHTALGHVAGDGKTTRSFNDVFVKHAETLAPFALRGGAKTLK